MQVKVYVVSFFPREDSDAAVGGFEWRFKESDAREEYAEQVVNAERYGEHQVRLVEAIVDVEGVVVPSAEASALITEQLDNRMYEVEHELPALEEYPSA